ncbi:MAG: trehalose-phosphatase [Pseudobdellovibrionaceae bacterium]|jgi:trehalose-6-phosphatase|nr:trehalose-phosphatase [Pseudobdellovibrionaceae bacterium]
MSISSHTLHELSAITVDAAIKGNLVWVPDQDGATVSCPVGIHTGFPAETELEKAYRILIDRGNIIFPISGRPEVFFDTAYPNLRNEFWIASEMGARITAPNGRLILSNPVPNRDTLIQLFEKEVLSFPGAKIEDGKTCAITLALTDATDRMKAFNHLKRVADEYARHDGVHIKSGSVPHNTHIEFVPQGIDKGSAAEFVVQTFPGKLIVSIGDSEPDVDMFVVFNDVGGYSIGVGPKAPDNCHTYLDTAQEGANFIIEVAREVERHFSHCPV